MGRIRKTINDWTVNINTKFNWKFVKANTWVLNEDFPILAKVNVNLTIKASAAGLRYADCCISSNYENILGNHCLGNVSTLECSIGDLELTLGKMIDALTLLISDFK
jgi:hypothetical protein